MLALAERPDVDVTFVSGEQIANMARLVEEKDDDAAAFAEEDDAVDLAEEDDAAAFAEEE